MTREVRTVGPGTSLRDLAALLSKKRLSGVPVVDADGAVIGVVSEWDILAKAQGRPEAHRSLIGRLFERDDDFEMSKFEARTAGEAMSSPIISVRPRDHVAKAAKLMLDNAINRLLVVQNDRLVGIVSRADLVRGFTQSDGEIEREIREDVIERQLWIAEQALTVKVTNGDVEIDGECETKMLAELLPTLIERVPGVLSLTSNLTWRHKRRQLIA